MQQIDLAALNRAAEDSASAVPPSRNAAPTQKSKALISVSRLDLGPPYLELKSRIGANWAEYKEAITLFLLGMWLTKWIFLQ